MVRGFYKFKEYFGQYSRNYVIIGGTACDHIVENAGFTPRATDDYDIVLIVEALDNEFVDKFWDFIGAGEYKTRQKDSLKRSRYRFTGPGSQDFPQQIELFSRLPDSIEPDAGIHLTPLPVDEGLSDLSAILLKDDYYRFTLENSIISDGIHYANEESLICLKAFAYLDNKRRKEKGQKIKTADITKHKNDVFRLVFLQTPDLICELPEPVRKDMQMFVDDIKNNLPDPAIFKYNGFGKHDMKKLLVQLVKIFNLTLNE